MSQRRVFSLPHHEKGSFHRHVFRYFSHTYFHFHKVTGRYVKNKDKKKLRLTFTNSMLPILGFRLSCTSAMKVTDCAYDLASSHPYWQILPSAGGKPNSLLKSRRSG